MIVDDEWTTSKWEIEYGWILKTFRPIDQTKKLDYKRVGPFKILLKHGPMAYKL